MRIAYLLTTLGMGGAEREAIEVAGRVSAEGHQVRIFVLGPEASEEWPVSLPVVRLGFKRSPLGLLRGLWRIRKEMKAFAPDLMHSHCFHSNIVARLARGLGVHAKVLSTIHNVYEGAWPRMLAYTLTDSLTNLGIFVCSAAADRALQAGAVRKSKALVVFNGIDLAEWSPQAGRREEIRAAMGVGKSFVWLSAGRLTAAKDFPTLLRAFSRVLQQRPETELWIAGEGSAAEQAALQRLGTELGLAGHLRWLGLRRDMAALLEAADGFVLNSIWEGMPLAIEEAMAMALPVVATDVGGVRELMAEEGRIVPARSPEKTAQAMLETASLNEPDRKRLGEQARRRIESTFSLERKTAEWLEIYRRVLNGADA